MSLLINEKRFKDNFDALAEIGSTGDGGVHRPALGEAHLQARRWLATRAAGYGLQTGADSAGNLSAVLLSSNPNAKTLLLGSHTDSVPNGGRFDGALGVISALEVLCAVKDAARDLPVHLEMIDFTDEEGTLVGLLGSSAVAGALSAETLKNPRGGRATLEAGMDRADLTDEGLLAAKRDATTLAGYLELHIEQGPRLARQGVPIGVVTGIVGIASYQLTFSGWANHAGTTPMEDRADASLGASAMVLRARELVMHKFPGCVVNVGQMAFKPGGFNIIPGVAVMALEFRSADAPQLAGLERALLALANDIAAEYGLKVKSQFVGQCTPAPMSAQAQQAISEAANSLQLSQVAMPSGAGHDAQSLAPLTPAGMIFIPSRDGISHSPQEFSEWPHCVNGANVLLRAALNMAGLG